MKHISLTTQSSMLMVISISIRFMASGLLKRALYVQHLFHQPLYSLLYVGKCATNSSDAIPVYLEFLRESMKYHKEML